MSSTLQFLIEVAALWAICRESQAGDMAVAGF
jgi:hypothetical protein